jgi:hypothetical protein
MRIAGGMHVAVRPIGSLSGIQQRHLRGGFEVTVTSRQQARVGGAVDGRGQPAHFQFRAHRDDQIGIAQRPHHRRFGLQHVRIAVWWRPAR